MGSFRTNQGGTRWNTPENSGTPRNASERDLHRARGDPIQVSKSHRRLRRRSPVLTDALRAATRKRAARDRQTASQYLRAGETRRIMGSEALRAASSKSAAQ